MKLKNRAKLSIADLSRIEMGIAEHNTLEQVLKWGFSQPAGAVHPHIIKEVVIQDEYSHDVIVPWRDGLVLVYATT